jgi:hypothetical protein
MVKINCWEYKKCGREPEGEKVVELGECPATVETRLNGVHGGTNAGRACWALVGTKCGGKVEGTYAKKYGNCCVCDFFNKVIAEEGTDYKFTPSILKLLE